MLKLYLWLVSLNNYWYPLKNCRYILFLIQQSFQLLSHARVCQFILSHAPHSLWLNLLVKSVNWLTETVWLKRLSFSFLRYVNIIYFALVLLMKIFAIEDTSLKNNCLENCFGRYCLAITLDVSNTIFQNPVPRFRAYVW